MLYLIRHAEAGEAAEDSLRPLSTRGREEARRLAEFFRGSGQLRPDEVWRSPLARAAETAAILAEQLAWKAAVHVVEGLEPEDFPGRLSSRITACDRSVAVIGHNPHLTGLATLLVTGSLGPAAFVFTKCAALALEPGRGRSPGSWVVRWMVTPEILA